MGSLIRASNLRGYHELVEMLGGDPAKLLTRFKIPVDVTEDDHAFLAYRNAGLLLEASARELNCPDFGLRLAKWQGLDILGPVAVIARSASTVLEALGAISQFLYLHSPALKLKAAAAETKGVLRFQYEILEAIRPQQCQSYELSLANGLGILRLLAGHQSTFTSVRFTHKQQAASSVYREIFSCPVYFEQSWCGFELTEELALQSIDSADAETRHLVAEYLEPQYMLGAARLSERVAELIRRLLPTGQCNANAISEHLAMHPRTLQRRLAEESTRYDLLLDKERRSQAERYLAQVDLRLNQITGLLGYAEQSTFNRSCKRWFGLTPMQFRQKMAE
ncbi:HTH-type transcriptional regulator VirS [Zhongshania aliphaticivorans]|uniref:HTH-type transcriptional regulator VirS n=1 Tax=Zhongshania aliphaticivorans TaxID=1470434 RepID=A0A5S9QLF0_9GAMM|nr:AraC family transcriptional regulator [Zhongshania aliphaticivorans]CAA0111406.1 HTH-type transcriptional regulator VirS [Zhongshania aliphaticivorans]CAA0118614.1 HTH-type transcriptional regulator VirS [Zhongshania aliphaticivorans]